MKTKKEIINRIIVVLLTIMVGLVGMLILISGLFNKKDDITQIQDEIKGVEVSNNINISDTTKKSKKVLKTTKKKTIKKIIKTVKVGSYSEYQSYAKQYGNYDDTQMNCLINLWNKESGWNPNSYNKKSGACGIPQALPCSKISKSEGSSDWKAQIRWGVKYINARYKTPCNAWNHFLKKHWY